jgi:hypothetical protein
LLDSAGPSVLRRARFEQIPDLATLAQPMAQGALHDAQDQKLGENKTARLGPKNRNAP